MSIVNQLSGEKRALRVKQLLRNSRPKRRPHSKIYSLRLPRLSSKRALAEKAAGKLLATPLHLLTKFLQCHFLQPLKLAHDPLRLRSILNAYFILRPLL